VVNFLLYRRKKSLCGVRGGKNSPTHSL